MGQETIHTFLRGMDLDTDKALRSKDVTYRVENMRPVTNIDGTTGALANILGNTEYYNIYGLGINYIAGYCLVRNHLIIFGTTNANSIIYDLILDENDDVDSVVEVYHDGKNNSTGYLDFENDNIRAVGRYESEDIIKVYWTDETNPTRFINIAVNNTTDGEVYNGITNYYTSPDKLEFCPNLLVSEFSSIFVRKGGNLQAGIVRYMYQFYNKYGAESLFSPMSNPIHITAASESLSTNKYKGSEVDESTGKSTEITFNHLVENVGYDYLKIIRVFYSTYGGTPTIDLAAEIEIDKYFTDPYKTYTIIDNGNSLYNYTSEEVAILGKITFSAKDITTKDDMLFFGNITEDYFDVDFDARAFRFPESSTTFYITNDGTDESYIVSADTNAGWDAILDDVGEDNDCINLLNDLTNDGEAAAKYNCKYQYNASTYAGYGGSGRNVRYEFVTYDFILDTQGDSDTSGTPLNTDARTIEAGSGTVGGESGYRGYANPYVDYSYRGYQRGETYRFGVMFHDTKGRPSKIKWIGDIRFPSLKESGYDGIADENSATKQVWSEALGIKFYLRNVPADAVAWSIVRMDRTSIDKTVVSQGVLSNTAHHSSGDFLPLFPTMKADSTPYGSSMTLQTEVLAYMSPDINYGDLDYRSGDYFEIEGEFDSYGTYRDQDDYTDGYDNTIKYLNFVRSTTTSTITPTDHVITVPEITLNKYTLAGVDVTAGVYWGISDTGILGTCMLFTHNEVSIPAVSAVDKYATLLVNLRRINNSQYGGNTYENRFGNEYISCGVVVNSTDDAYTTSSTYSSTGKEVYGGDTFIVMYERLHSMYYADANELCRICYIPVESKYNLLLNSGFTYSRNVSNQDDIRLVRENAGTHSDGADILEQDADFYVYNTVYSSCDSIVKYYSATNLDTDITEYDTRIIVSDVKINNEVVDSWTKFGASNYKDVDSLYGALTNLINFKNKIFYLQERAFGLMAINEKSIVVDSNNSGAIVLGTGGVMDRYEYISTYYGNTNLQGVVATEFGIYWVDNHKSELVQYTGDQLQSLSKVKSVDTFFKNIYGEITDLRIGVLSKYNEVWFKLTAGATDTDVLIYNELHGQFTGFYTIPVYDFIYLRRKLLSLYKYTYSGTHYIDLYEEDKGLYCSFYGIVYPSSIYILHSDGYPHVKVYDNLEWASSVKNGDIYVFSKTFNTIQIYNDYQNTGEVTLVVDTNLRRRERIWTTAVPRNTVKVDVSSDPDIQDPANLNTALSYKERIRDNYTIIKLEYLNSSSYVFYVPYIKVKYRISPR